MKWKNSRNSIAWESTFQAWYCYQVLSLLWPHEPLLMRAPSGGSVTAQQQRAHNTSSITPPTHGPSVKFIKCSHLCVNLPDRNQNWCKTTIPFYLNIYPFFQMSYNFSLFLVHYNYLLFSLQFTLRILSYAIFVSN